MRHPTRIPIFAAVLALCVLVTACRPDSSASPLANEGGARVLPNRSTMGRGKESGGDSSDPVAAFPVNVRDDRGATVTIPAEPRRIVALLPSHTETLFALGVGDRVVGVDDYSDYPPQAERLPRLGGLYDTRLEVVLSLKPDLALVSDTSAAAAPLERSGIPVWAGSARAFDDVFGVIETIGRMVGRGAEAKRLSERIARDVAVIENRLRAVDRVRVYYELDGNLYTVGPSSFIGAMIAKAGGDNIVPEGLGDFPRISPEAVIAGNPSVIFGASLEEVTTRPGWSKIAAVQTARAYKLPKAESQVVLHPGPRIAKGLRVLARRLHPEVAL
jgi:iron complex transport system substrate-binding protein